LESYIFKNLLPRYLIMTGLGRKGETFIECPFCHKAQVRLFHKEGYIQGRTSRISAGAKITYYKVPDSYKVLENCPNCGKTASEIQKALDEDIPKRSHRERIERLKQAGLPTRIVS